MRTQPVKNPTLSQIAGRPVYELHSDKKAQLTEDIIRRGISLKAKIEKAGRNWSVYEDTDELLKAGIPAPKIKKLNQQIAFATNSFLDLLIGPFYAQKHRSQTLVSMPADLVIGAPWQGHEPKNRKEAISFFKDSDKWTAESEPLLGAKGSWYYPFPLIRAGEGKNRVSLAQEHQIPYLSQVFHYEVAPPESLTLRRVIFSKHWLLQCSDEHYYPGVTDSPFKIKQNEFLVAFPSLTLPLLSLYGVKTGRPVFRIAPKIRFKCHMLNFLRGSLLANAVSPW